MSAADTTTYSVGYDPATDEYVADAGGQVFASEHAALAYAWLASQILADEADADASGRSQ